MHDVPWASLSYLTWMTFGLVTWLIGPRVYKYFGGKNISTSDRVFLTFVIPSAVLVVPFFVGLVLTTFVQSLREVYAWIFVAQ